jgi:hypothetical protein
VLIALANSQSIVIASRKYVLYARDDEKGNCDGRHPQSAGLAEDGSIDVDFAGGRLKTPDGQLVSWRVFPIRYCVQPGHTYLMRLTEYPGGIYHDIDKEWDVTTGKVVADRPDDLARAEKGRSKLSGRSLPMSSRILNPHFPEFCSVSSRLQCVSCEPVLPFGSFAVQRFCFPNSLRPPSVIWRNRKKKPRPRVSHTSRNPRNFCERGDATLRCPTTSVRKRKSRSPQLRLLDSLGSPLS